MTGETIVIAGPWGGKSTFLGGLHHCIDGMDRFSGSYEVLGDEARVRQDVLEQMFTLGEYPARTREPYAVSYEIHPGSELVPTSTVTLLHPPGDVLGRCLERYRHGDLPDAETVRERYERDVQPPNEGGRALSIQDEWETTVTHHYQRADRAIFLLNLHKALFHDVCDILYDRADIERATREFEKVAVVPTAVDCVGYDPERGDPGWREHLLGLLFGSDLHDDALLEHLHEMLGPVGVNDIVHIAWRNEAVDCFGVAVPDEGSPGEQTGHLTPDGEGGFETRGFERVLEWLNR